MVYFFSFLSMLLTASGTGIFAFLMLNIIYFTKKNIINFFNPISDFFVFKFKSC
jgi:hypothetical protein